MKKLNVYLVGGAVRDILLGLDPKDKDYVVVGSSEEEMLSLGFEQVGKDFPVFLHPETGYEYALARKERKTGNGYGGFSVDTSNVTLKDDLFRRDLTINAMAMTSDGQLIDPFGGQKDLKNGILKHVSTHFAEDPVRILRIARFSARYNFAVDESTLSMMKNMVQNGEFDHLTAERVWKEFEKTLSETHLTNFFKVLNQIGALNKIGNFSTLLENIDFLNKIENSTLNNKNLSKICFIFQDFSEKQMNAWRVPSEHIENIAIFKNWITNKNFYSSMTAQEKLKFLKQTKAIHENEKPNLLAETILFQLHEDNDFSHELNVINSNVKSLRAIDYESISQQAKINKENIGKIIQTSQIKALEYFDMKPKSIKL